MEERIAVCSYFRDSEIWHGREIAQVGRFFRQLRGQGLPLDIYVAEGNSKDNTREALHREAEEARKDGHKVTILDCTTDGSSEVVSLASETRFRNLSHCGNVVLNAAKSGPLDHIFWVESDFIIKNDKLIKSLLNKLKGREPECLAICPVPTYETRGEFYDTFVWRSDKGGTFGPSMEPFGGDSLIKLTAFGSCGLMRAKLLNEHNLDFMESCFMALCEKAHNLGLTMYADTTLRIYHPSRENVAGRLI